MIRLGGTHASLLVSHLTSDSVVIDSVICVVSDTKVRVLAAAAREGVLYQHACSTCGPD